MNEEVIIAITILAGFIVGYLFDNLWAIIVRRFSRKKDEYVKFIVRRIRIHHNFLGYILIIVGFYVYPAFLVSAGIGMLAGHKIRDNLFWFVEVIEQEVKSIKEEVKKGKKEIKGLERKLEKEVGMLG